MYEHPSFSTNLNKLCVKIKTTGGNEGTGILYVSKSNEGKVYVITAKHCLLDGSGRLAAVETISIQQSGTTHLYHLIATDQILTHSEVDFAILIISQVDLNGLLGDLPTVMLAEDNAGETETFFYGFPNAFKGLEATRVNTTLLPPIAGEIINLESNLHSEHNLTEDTVTGLSGSGIALKCADNIYLIGIIIRIAEWNRFIGLSINYLNQILKTNHLVEEPTNKLEANPELIRSHRILKNNSQTLLDSINENIGGLHVDRAMYVEEAISKLAENNVLVISGIAGVGKSTFSKVLLDHLRITKNAKVLSFFGTQICNPNSTELLSLLGITNSMTDLIESRDMLGLKVIYIDSAEKGFEHHQIEVIKELLRLTLTHKELKIILSIRSYSLTLSTFGLFSSIAVPYGKLNLTLLSNLEIKPVLSKYPKLNALLQNPKIETFVRTPFYLNLLVDLINESGYHELDELSLKNMLWQKVIRKDNSVRERFFENIALKRAKMMLPYVTLQEDNSELELKSLLSDHVIKENVDEFGIRTYAPSHDILEDWALVRHMRKTFESTENLETFIDEIGSSYAMRRGFRFWLQEVYRIDTKNAHLITLKTLTENSIEEFWKDEVIVALLNSSDCTKFLIANRLILLQDNAKLLIRCIHLVRTACKSMYGERIPENHLDEREYMTSDILLPTGPGWHALVDFIKNNFSEFQNQNYLVSRFLLDWGRLGTKELSHSSKSAAFLILKLISIYGKDYVRRGNEATNDLCIKLIGLLIKLSKDNKQEVEAFIKNSYNFVRDKNYRSSAFSIEELNKLEFHERVLESSLDYNVSAELCHYLPELVWQIAEYVWFDDAELEAVAKEKEDGTESYPRLSEMLNFDREPEKEELFGISSQRRLDFYPASAYQTPFPHLLRYHPLDAVDYFTALMNRSLQRYMTLKRAEVEEISIRMNDGTKVQLFGNEMLWGMYRGSHSVPDLLSSLHMALENYLLDLAKSNTKETKAELDLVVSRLLTQNTSVSVTGVLASIATAYPFAMVERMLPIFSFKEAFKWDFQRVFGERNVFTPPDLSGKNPGAQKERVNSKQLPHRQEKLEFLAFKMSFYDGFSQVIKGFIDDYYLELESGKPNDYQHWPHVLLRIDRSKYRITGETETQVIIEPELPDKMRLEMEEARRKIEADSGITIWSWCHLILHEDKQEANTIQNWRRFRDLSIKLLKEDSTDSRMYNSPMGIAEIGLRFYKDELTQEEKLWCVTTTLSIAEYFINKEFKQYNMGFGLYSTWNRETAFGFLPSLLHSSYGSEIVEQVKGMLNISIHVFKIDDGINKPLFEKIAKGCWQNNYEFSKLCFTELLKNAVEPNWRESVAEEIVNGFPNLRFNEDYHCLLNLDKAFLFLTECSLVDSDGYNFLMTYQRFLISNTYRSNQRNSNRRQREYSQSDIHFQFKYGQFMLEHQDENAELLFIDLINVLLALRQEEDIQNITEGTLKLTFECLKDIILYEDRHRKTDRFHAVWSLLLKKSLEYGRVIFLKFLLLDWYWRDSADSWPVIQQEKDFYVSLVETLGSYDIDRSISLMAGIGFKDLFPESLDLFRKLIGTSSDSNWSLKYDSEKYIQRAFFTKGSEIKANRKFRESFSVILDKMIETGSSMAYLIKESFVSV